MISYPATTSFSAIEREIVRRPLSAWRFSQCLFNAEIQAQRIFSWGELNPMVFSGA
jgi:hypothetical protein